MTSSPKRDLRPETPTRALLRRVQRRSSAGGDNIVPPVPQRKKSTASKLRQEVQGEHQSSKVINVEKTNSCELENRKGELLDQIEELNQDIKTKDARIEELEELLREATIEGQSSSNSHSGGLTQAAALKLEREFASQEFILQGLQKDNEAKTIEVERLRRDKKTMSDYLARQLGSDDWEFIVFGANSSFHNNRKEVFERQTSVRDVMASETSSTPLRPFKIPASRLVQQSSDGIDSSFFSADESMMDHRLTFLATSPVKAAPIKTTATAGKESSSSSAGGIDLAAMLTLIEAQKMLIKGFERSNSLKMIECQETIKRAKEKEQLWNKRIEQHMQKSIDVTSAM